MLKSAGIISQARMTSSRLPGKILMRVAGKTLLEYHIERLRWAQLPVVIASTTNPTDDPIIELCTQLHVPFFRGDENDVLSRYYGAAQQAGFDAIVRVTSDCPLVDGQLIEQAMQHYLDWNNPNIYYSNALQRTFPRGFDFEIFSFAALEEAFYNGKDPYEREHVTPYIKYRLKDGMYRHFTHDLDLSGFRMTVDEKDDLRLMEQLIGNLHCDQLSFRDMEPVLLKNKELFQINAHVEQKR